MLHVDHSLTLTEGGQTSLGARGLVFTRHRHSAGTKLPAIAELMREFDVPGLNTIRDAQQLLVREGLIRTEQGVGAWVISRTSPTADQTQALREARAQLDQAIAYLEAQDEGR